MTRKTRRDLERALDDLEQPEESPPECGILIISGDEHGEYPTAEEIEQRYGGPPEEVAELVMIIGGEGGSDVD
jgi:hypothetical protein